MHKSMRTIQTACLAVLLGCMPLFGFASLEQEGWEPKKTHALIVSVLEWENGLSGFSKRHRKDEELRDLLVKRGTPAQNITMLLDEQASLPAIRKAIATTLGKLSEDSTLIIYYQGHGWAAGDDYCFANYDVKTKDPSTVWSLKELADTVAKGFKGQRAFFWADCCYSGGLSLIVDKLATKKVTSFSLSSASTENSSTGNWTFTQSLLDALSGAPLIDTNSDGLITLGELRTEVSNAMKHMEGQRHGFTVNGVADTFVLAKTHGQLKKVPQAKFPLGSYVVAKGKYGRVVGVQGENADEYSVQFYNYTDKVVKQYAQADLVLSKREPGKRRPRRGDARMQPDCTVEWHGSWYNAKILKAQEDRWYIHYIGDPSSYDEWVGKDRIRLKEKVNAGG